MAVFDQMDSTQDLAEVHVLILSPDYLASAACLHEMERALALDPHFKQGRVVPVLRVACDLPEAIRRPNPLYVNLTDDGTAEPWDLLMRACGADIGAAVPDWLQASNSQC